MKKFILFSLFIPYVVTAASYQTTIDRQVSSLKSTADKIKKADELDKLREQFSALQTAIDEFLEDNGISQMHASYYRNEINNLDVSMSSYLTVISEVEKANIMMARVVEVYKKYQHLVESFKSKALRYQTFYMKYGRDRRDFATIEWVAEKYGINNLISNSRSWFDKEGVKHTMYYYSQSLDILSQTPNFEFEERKCGNNCWCRAEWKYDHSFCTTLLEKFRTLANNWAKFNAQNEIPD